MMNFYPYHNSELDRYHSLAVLLSKLGYAGEKDVNEWAPLKPVIKNSTFWAMWFAKEVMKERWYEAEPYIMQEPYYVYLYAKEIIKGRWPEAEHYWDKQNDPDSEWWIKNYYASWQNDEYL